MANTYFTLSHPDVEAGAVYRFTSLVVDSLVRGKETPRAVEYAADGSVLLTLGATTYRTHSLNLLVMTQSRIFGLPSYQSYGEYGDLEALHAKGEATFVDWDGTTTYPVVFPASRLEPNWLTPDGSILTIRLEMMEKV